MGGCASVRISSRPLAYLLSIQVAECLLGVNWVKHRLAVALPRAAAGPSWVPLLGFLSVTSSFLFCCSAVTFFRCCALQTIAFLLLSFNPLPHRVVLAPCFYLLSPFTRIKTLVPSAALARKADIEAMRDGTGRSQPVFNQGRSGERGEERRR